MNPTSLGPGLSHSRRPHQILTTTTARHVLGLILQMKKLSPHSGTVPQQVTGRDSTSSSALQLPLKNLSPRVCPAFLLDLAGPFSSWDSKIKAQAFPVISKARVQPRSGARAGLCSLTHRATLPPLRVCACTRAALRTGCKGALPR